MDRPDRAGPPWRGVSGLAGAAGLRLVARRAEQHAATPGAGHPDALTALRQRLRREPLGTALLAQALGAVAAVARHTLGQTPRRNQLHAAAALLDHRLAEMATGEGKTLAVALAAAVAALAGVPVHVATANDYLATRDASLLAPFYAALGLSVAARPGAGDDSARRAVYGADVVHATARDLAFDWLRDRQAAQGAAERHAAALAGTAASKPVMRGLCLALIDEADSILLDEAELPLVLSRPAPQAARRAFLWQALALARRLVDAQDFVHHTTDRLVRLTPVGEERLEHAARALGGPWQRPRYRREAVQLALAALHAYRRHEHYVVRDGAVEVLDEVTGRVSAGRVWSRGLHTLLAFKEGLKPADETETLARTTFQRFFQRYWRLGGLSGTLWEARGELLAVYGLPVNRIAAHRPCRRQVLPARHFTSRATLLAAAASRAASLAAAGRPVLVGTDSVADSEAVAAALAAQGVPHHVLNALHDAEEAAIVAAAGRAATVTVATRMAGRGTDIELDAAARAAGGLHVIDCQHNPSRRLDRQLAGRAARRGEPGSVEAWRCAHLAATGAQAGAASAEVRTPWKASLPPFLRGWLAKASHTWRQRREEGRRVALRRDLLRQDLAWERRLAFAGPPA
ncbi:MAG: hypothetical protein Q7U73_05915 [Rubrivivax sp.]|nr:hypothetical protein [Rubrivivax sp.]